MTANHVPASARPAGIDTSSQLPRRLRPPARDLPGLAWLAARRFGQHPDGRLVGRYPAAAAFPLWLVLLLLQHAAGALAARGRHAFLVVAPTWPAARRPYRTRMTTAAAAATGGIVLLAALGLVVLYGADAAASAAGAPSTLLTTAASRTAQLALLAWLVGLLAHPLRKELAGQALRSATTGDAVAPGDRTLLVGSLCGRSRPSGTAIRLLRDVLEHADARSWALLTDGALQDRNARQYARMGFSWLPDGSRRMLRPATTGPALVDDAVEQAATLAGRLGVHLDEVRVVDGHTADSGVAGGRSYVRLPMSSLLPGAQPPHAPASLAHELGHHALGHFTPAGDRRRSSLKFVALVPAAAAGLAVALIAPPAVAAAAPGLGLAGWLAAAWLCDRGVRRGEYEADAIAATLVGVDDVAAQLRRLHAREQAVGRVSRTLGRLIDTTHPPLPRRIERVLQQEPTRRR